MLERAETSEVIDLNTLALPLYSVPSNEPEKSFCKNRNLETFSNAVKLAHEGPE